MHKFKTIIVGDSGVGKSSILWKLVNKEFNQNMDPTIGLDYFAYRFKKNNINIKLTIWDTAGQEQFDSIIKIYFKDVHLLIIVADISNSKSCGNIEKWILKVIKHNKNSDLYKNKNIYKMPILVIFNKLDKRDISTLQGYDCNHIVNRLSPKYNIKHIELSALKNKNMMCLKNMFVDIIFDNYSDILVPSKKKNKTCNDMCNDDRYSEIDDIDDMDDIDEIDEKNCCGIS